MTVQFIVGDTREVTATLADASVDLIATSPPFLNLRSYLPQDHADKASEIGGERNPAEFIDMLLGLTAEWGRVLAPHGSIAVELGDTYSGSGGAGGDYGPTGLRKGAPGFDGSAARTRSNRPGQYGTETGPPRRLITDAWPRAKCLALIPQLYAVALAYGINPLTGAPSPAGRWLVRNVVVWHRSNPAVGALADKVRPSTSYIVIATRSAKRWFDLTAVRGEPSPNTHARLTRGVDVAPRNGKSADRDGNYATMPELAQTAGAPPLDCWTDEYDGTHDTWTLTTQPSSLRHFAMWPARLAERLILMMCPSQVCRKCGEPRRRVEGPAEYVTNGKPAVLDMDRSRWAKPDELVKHFETVGGTSTQRITPTLGWTDCGCAATDVPVESGNGNDPGGSCVVDSRMYAFCRSTGATLKYRPGLTLDPFCGSGTSLAVADLHDRDAVGIDLDPRNHDIYPRRYDEVKRALFGTVPEMAGQQGLWD